MVQSMSSEWPRHRKSHLDDADARLRDLVLAALERDAIKFDTRLGRVVRRYVESQSNPRTGRSYAQGLRVFLQFCEEMNTHPFNLGRHDIERYRPWLDGRFSATPTANHRWGVARRFLDYARAHHKMVRHTRLARRPNPFLGQKAPKIISREPNALTEHQFHDLVTVLLMNPDALPGREVDAPTETDPLFRIRDFVIIFVAGRIGLRTIEIIRSTFGDRRTIRDQPRLTVHGKGNREDDMTLPEDVVNLIEIWRVILEHELGRPIRGSDALFPKVGRERSALRRALARGEPLQPPSGRLIAGRVKRWFAVIGVTGHRSAPHLLRSTAATLAFENEADLLAIQRMLRHASLATTVAYIARLVDRPSAASTWTPFATAHGSRPSRAPSYSTDVVSVDGLGQYRPRSESVKAVGKPARRRRASIPLLVGRDSDANEGRIDLDLSSEDGPVASLRQLIPPPQISGQ